MSTEWTADKVLELARSYQTACILAAAADLDLFDLLQPEAMTADAVARATDADRRGTAALLDALAALDLLEKRGDSYTLAPGVQEFLTADGRQSMLAMVQHHANCLRRWAQLTQVVKTGRPAERRPSIRGEPADSAAFVVAMDNVCAPIADTVIAEIGPLHFRHVLDIGGATGTWTLALLRRYPDATATLFDLPHVIPLARERITAAGFAERVKLVAGDFESDALPPGADLAWVSAIIHQNSREQNRKLFNAVFEALSAGGQVLIRDVLMEDSHIAPQYGALFAINMLVATEGGGTFTLREMQEDLNAAGFEDVAVLRHDEAMNSVIRAVKQQ